MLTFGDLAERPWLTLRLWCSATLGLATFSRVGCRRS